MAGSVWKQTCRSKVVSGRSEGHTGWHRVYLNVVYVRVCIRFPSNRTVSSCEFLSGREGCAKYINKLGAYQHYQFTD